MEATKVMLSFLGTGKYEQVECVYKGQAHVATHVQHALARFFPEYELRVAMTPTARERNGGGLMTLQYGEIELPDGTKDHIGHFTAIAGAIPEGCDLIVDVTHGFRFQPVLALAAAQLLAEAKNVRVVDILYLSFEPGVRTSELISLKAYLDLLEWSKAASVYQESGNAAAFGSKLKEIQRSAHLNKEAALPTAFSAFADQTERLGLEIELNRVSGARKTLAKISARLDAMEAEIEGTPLAMPMRLIWSRVRIALGGLISSARVDEPHKNVEATNADGAGLLQFSSKLLQEHLRFGRYVQAITLAREAIVSFYTYEAGLDPHTMHAREAVEKHLNGLRQPSWRKGAAEAGGDGPMFRVAPDVALWDKVAQVRNDINHAGQGRQESSASRAKSNIVDLCEQVVRLMG